jgi:tetratricopeptide (TPR) repeat protein
LAEAIDVALHECPALAEAIQAPGEDLIGVIDVTAMRGDRGHILHLAYYHHARAYAIQGSLSQEDSEQAVEDLQNAIALAPLDRNAVPAEHDFEPFLGESKFVRAVFGSFENAAREYTKRATDFVQEGDLQEAEWSYSWALALIDQAGDETTEAQKKDRLLSEQASLHTGLADLYAKQAKWDLALAEHEKAIVNMVEAGMDDVAYLRRSELVEALYSGGQMDEAIIACQEWGEEFEAHPPGAIACGSVYRDSQDFGDALDSYTQAISHTQTISYTQIVSTTADLAEAYYQRARLYARQSEAELLLGDLAEAIQHNYSLIARSAFEPDFGAFQRDSRFRQLVYPNIERIDVKDETTLIFNLPAPSPAFQFQLIALMRLEGLPPLISYQEKTGEGVQAQADMSVSQDKLVWTFRLREDAPYKASELQAQLLQTPSLGQEAQVPPEPITPVSDKQEHTVSSDDDLEGLAERFLDDPHLYPAIIYATNQKHAEDDSFAKIPAPGPLEPGSRIYIPGLGGDAGREYVVQAEDSLESLADKFLDDSEAYPAIIYATDQKHAEDETFAKAPGPSPVEPGSKIYIPNAEEVEIYFDGLFMP